MAARHRFEEETSELRVHVEAPTCAALFEEAGRALAEVMAGGADAAAALPEPEAPAEAVALDGRDREALLVAWLNELIYRAETRGRVYTDLQVEALGEHTLSAAIRGRAAPEARALVKAATFHGLRIVEGPEGVSATIVLDI